MSKICDELGDDEYLEPVPADIEIHQSQGTQKDLPKFPLANQVTLSGHSKSVSALSIDPSGNRLITGSLDYGVQIFDFGGMDSRFQSFKRFEASAGHPVSSICHSPSGDRFVVGTGSCQAKVYDRDGNEIITFVRGDMYLRDLANTKGHTMEITCVQWHPTQINTIITSSLDGTVRVWDLKGEALFGSLINKHVLKLRLTSATASVSRHSATCCAYSCDGKYILAGSSDGHIFIWQDKKVFSRTDFSLAGVHQGGVTSIVVHSQSLFFFSRGEEGSIHMWDLKKVSNKQAPIKSFRQLPSIYSMSTIALSPDNNYLICGVSSFVEDTIATSTSNNAPSTKDKKIQRQVQSRLVFLNACNNDNTEIEAQIGMDSNSCVIAVKWVASTNQIFCSTSLGTVNVYYDPLISKKGAMLSAGKAPKRAKDPSDFGIIGEIISPNALPMFRVDKRGELKRKLEEREATVPERPTAQGPGSRLNTSFFFTQYVSEGKGNKRVHQEDAREALLKYAEKAEKDPIYFGKAYKDNQPSKLLDTKTLEETMEETKKKMKQFH